MKLTLEIETSTTDEQRLNSASGKVTRYQIISTIHVHGFNTKRYHFSQTEVPDLEIGISCGLKELPRLSFL